MAAVMRKGQLSMEFILIILVLLLIMSTVMQPNLMLAEDVLGDSQRLGEAVHAFDRITNSIELLDSTLTGRQTLHLFLPKRSNITCDPVIGDLNILIEVDRIPEKSKEAGSCIEGTPSHCFKNTSVANLSCLDVGGSSTSVFIGGRYINLEITKTPAGITIQEAT